jgi:hypothetical protein
MRETLNISTCADSSNNTRKLRNKPAVQAAGADPYQCNSSTMQNQDKLKNTDKAVITRTRFRMG